MVPTAICEEDHKLTTVCMVLQIVYRREKKVHFKMLAFFCFYLVFNFTYNRSVDLGGKNKNRPTELWVFPYGRLGVGQGVTIATRCSWVTKKAAFTAIVLYVVQM